MPPSWRRGGRQGGYLTAGWGGWAGWRRQTEPASALLEELQCGVNIARVYSPAGAADASARFQDSKCNSYRIPGGMAGDFGGTCARKPRACASYAGHMPSNMALDMARPCVL